MDQPTKPGFKTTEFWLSAGATALSYLLASGATDGLDDSNILMRGIGMATTVLVALGYTVSRSLVKKGS